MSNLKHLNEGQLREAKEDTEKGLVRIRRRILYLERSLADEKSRLSGQGERLKWVNLYLDAAVQRRLGGVPAGTR